MMMMIMMMTMMVITMMMMVLTMIMMMMMISYRSPTITRHSASSSDCASLSQYSHEADLVERLQTPQELTLTDNPFNPLDSLHHGSHGDGLNTDHSLSTCTSVPHLSRSANLNI